MRSIRPALFASLVVFAGVAIASFLPDERLWGFNHLAFYPVWVRVLALLLVAVAFAPPAARKGYRAITGVLMRLEDRRGLWLPAVVSVGAAGLFAALRSATLLLGDGRLVASTLERGLAGKPAVVTGSPGEILLYEPNAKGASLLYYVAARILRSVLQVAPADAIRAVSCVLGGLLVLVLLGILRRAAIRRDLRIWIGVCALSSGMMQLFFGYVENYAPLVVLAAAYVLCGMMFLRVRRPQWLAACAAALALAIFAHLLGVLLLPSVGLLILWHLGLERRARGLRIAAPTLLAALSVGAFIAGASTRYGAHFLPVMPSSEITGVLAPSHWLDMLNQIMLLLPAFPVVAVMGLAVLAARGRRGPGTTSQFVLLVLAPCLLFLLVFRAEISMPRDWDLFALAAVGLIPAAVLVAREALPATPPSAVAALTAPVLAISAVLGAAWVGINASSARSASRYEHILNYETTRGAYAYEILAQHYHDEHRLDKAARVVEKGLSFSDNARLYALLGEYYAETGNTQTAIDVLERAVVRFPRHEGARRNLVLLLDKTGRYDELLEVAREGTQQHPREPVYHYYYGRMLLRRGETAEGIAHLL